MYGRGRGGSGRGGFGRGAQLPFERFPEIENLGKARYSESKRQLIMWSMDMQKKLKSSPYYYESANKVEKMDIQRYSDRERRATGKKRLLGHYIYMDADHVPGELAKDGGARVAKNVRWDTEFDASKFDDAFKKLEKKASARVKELMMMRNADEDDKEEEEDDDDDEMKDDDDEESDDNLDGDYVVPFDDDDDEDDFNKTDSDDNEGDTY